MKNMKNIKVLVLSHMYPNNSHPNSGIFIHNQIKHLLKEGCSVKVISPVPYAPNMLNFNATWKKYNEIYKQKVIDGVHVSYPRYIRFPGSWFHSLSCYTMYWGIQNVTNLIMKEFNPDILHVHTVTTDGYVGMLINEKYKLPIVCSLRGSDINTYPYRDKLTMLLTKKVLSKADQIVSVSHALKSTAETIANPLRPIRVLHNGCDLMDFSFNEEDRIAIRKDLGIMNNDRVIIFVGDIKKIKGVFELINSFITLKAKYSDIHLIVLGEGPENNNIKNIIHLNNMNNNVHLIGTRPHHEISKWLSASDIFALPTYNEGLPNVVLEAMACGLPVVATSVGGIPEIVEDGKSGILIKKKDPVSLAKAIESLLSDVKLAKIMGMKGREIAESKFSWQKNSETLIEIYNEVISAKD